MQELLIFLVALMLGYGLGMAKGECQFARYLSMKGDGPGSNAVKLNGKWYVIIPESDQWKEGQK